MATRDELMGALRKADAAGDVEAARAIAAAIRDSGDVPAPTRQDKVASGEPRKAPPKERSWGDVASQFGRDIIEGGGKLVSQAYDAVPTAPIGKIANAAWSVAAPYVKSAGKGTRFETLTNMLPNSMDQGEVVRNAAVKAADALKLTKPRPYDKLNPGVGRADRLQSAVTQGAVQAAVPIPGAGLVGVGKQVLGGVGGAVAADVAKEEFEAPPAVQAIAGLIGGVTTPMAVSGVKNALTGVASRSRLSSGEEAAARALQRNTLDPNAAATAIETNLPNASPNTRPTTAEVAQDPRFAAMQRNRGNTIIQQRQGENAQARLDTVGATMGPGDPNAVQRIAQGRQAVNEGALTTRQQGAAAAEQQARQQAEGALTRQQAVGEGKLTRLQARIERAKAATQARGETAVQDKAAAVGPAATRTESGQTIRPAIKGAWDEAKDVTRTAYEDSLLKNPHPITLAPREVNRLFKDLSGTVDKFFANANGEVPAKVRNTLNGFLKELDADNLNTATVQNVDRQLADFAGEWRVQGGNKNSNAAFAEELRDVLAARTNKHVPPEVAAQLEYAKSAKRDESARFGSGTARLGPIIEPKRYGFEKVPENELARRLVTGGDAGGTLGIELRNAVGHEKASKLVAEEFRRLAEEGSLNTPAAMRKYDPVLKEFPEVKASIDAMRAQQAKNVTVGARVKAREAGLVASRKAATAAETAQVKATGDVNIAAEQARGKQSVAQAQADVDKFAASPLGRTAEQNAKPEIRIPEIMNNPAKGERDMAELYEQIKHDPRAVAGARKALAAHIEKLSLKGADFDQRGVAIPESNPSIGAIENVLTRGGKLLDDKQRTALKQIQDELKQVEFARTRGSEKAGERVDSFAPVGTQHGGRIISWLIRHGGNEKAVDALIQKAILDPNEAVKMLRRATPNRIKNFKGTVGRAAIGAVLATQPEQ